MVPRSPSRFSTRSSNSRHRTGSQIPPASRENGRVHFRLGNEQPEISRFLAGRDVLMDLSSAARTLPSLDTMTHPSLDTDTDTCSEEPLIASAGQKRRWGLLVPGLVGGSLVALYALATPFVAPALRRVCLPFVPATPRQVENVLRMVQGRSGLLVDVGSGDGRIVTAAAKQGFRAVGYELNPWLVWFSRYHAWREGVQDLTTFHLSDLWKVNFSQYSNVVIFGVPQMMPLLAEKLEQELAEDARVVACRFPFPSWKPDQVAGEGIDTVWAYDARSFRRGR
ncbi:ATP synthase subunit C lysine N-methyltransferase [Suncus etruscus]|uniref:ATP synthase subunit C lysine N-methyltransferase n=1 Tax=Suncus etruscus TaxID=109475 RepID=UPI0021102E06|nr:ATP synthase subunit C lysine N-methyltransferase [Suncus etruscus]